MAGKPKREVVIGLLLLLLALVGFAWWAHDGFKTSAQNSGQPFTKMDSGITYGNFTSLY